jgi:dienelactone hydrolase
MAAALGLALLLQAPTDEEALALIRKALFLPPALPPLEVRDHGTFEPEPGVLAERVTYGTLFGLRVPAIVYRPKAASGKGPGLAVVNGHGGSKHSWYAAYAGVLYARAGAVVVTYDPIGEGERHAERKLGTRAHDARHDPPEAARRLAGLMITDVMQAVSYLRQRPDVEPRRVALTGYSLGSFVVALTGAVDARVRSCVMVGGGNLDGPEEYWDRSKPMCQGLPYRSLAGLGDRPAVLYALHAARGPTLVYNGSEDQVVGMPADPKGFFDSLRKRVAARRGTDAGVFDVGFEPGGHRPYFVTRPVALWLERQVDLPAWTAKDIEAMPETPIGEWAGGTLERGYASAHHEGGTRALGAGVPRLARETLDVFSPEEWAREKETLIYETWLEKAKSLSK